MSRSTLFNNYELYFMLARRGSHRVGFPPTPNGRRIPSLTGAIKTLQIEHMPKPAMAAVTKHGMLTRGAQSPVGAIRNSRTVSMASSESASREALLLLRVCRTMP
jgi:hypothetical protein